MAKKITLEDLHVAQPKWFEFGNKEFFNDLQYVVVYGKKTGDAYLAQQTTGFSDMFGGKKKVHWRLHTIEKKTCKIKDLLEGIYQDMAEIEEYLEDL